MMKCISVRIIIAVHARRNPEPRIFPLQSKTLPYRLCIWPRYNRKVRKHYLVWGSSPLRQGWLQTTVAHAGVSCPLHGYFDIHIKDRLGKSQLSLSPVTATAVWLGGDGNASFSCVCDLLLDRTAKMEAPRGMSVFIIRACRWWRMV